MGGKGTDPGLPRIPPYMRCMKPGCCAGNRLAREGAGIPRWLNFCCWAASTDRGSTPCCTGVGRLGGGKGVDVPMGGSAKDGVLEAGAGAGAAARACPCLRALAKFIW